MQEEQVQNTESLASTPPEGTQSAAASPEDRSHGPVPELLVHALHILVLSSFAIAQPLFDLLGRNAEFFVVRGSMPGDILLLVVLAVFLVPSGLCVIEAIARACSVRLERFLHLVFVGTLLAMIVLPPAKRMGLPLPLVLLAVAVVAIVGVGLYRRFRPFRSRDALIGLMLIVVAFPVHFLVLTPVSKLVLPTSSVDAEEMEAEEMHADEMKAEVSEAAGVNADTNLPPVVFIVFDALPVVSLMDARQQINDQRYPHFAELAQGATWYRNATTVAQSTTDAVPAILTGNYPAEKRLPTLSDHPQNIFTLLSSTYLLKASEAATQLCPKELCVVPEPEPMQARTRSLVSDVTVVLGHILLPTELSSTLPSITETWKDFVAAGPQSEPVRSFKELQIDSFIHGLQKHDRPTFYFLHVVLPHGRWEFLPSGKSYVPLDVVAPRNSSPAPAGGRWQQERWSNIQDQQRHLLQVGFVDRVLGRILDRLRSEDLYDRSMIVVTADHGISFTPWTSRRVFSAQGKAEIMSVPLLIKLPGQKESQLDERVAETIDILPTVADLLGIEMPWTVDGTSLAAFEHAERDSRRFYKNGGDEPIIVEELLVEKALERQSFLFGTRPQDLFAVGPWGELVGNAPGEWEIPGPGGLPEVDLDSALLRDVDPSADVMPSLISGQLAAAGIGEPLHLAVSVNGRIQAVTQAYRQQELMKFSALVPAAAFIPGRNPVDLFKVEGVDAEGAEGAKLVRLDLRQEQSYSIRRESSTGAEEIVSSRGDSLRIESRGLRGELTSAKAGARQVILRGWMADLKSSDQPDEILIFVNGESIFSGRANALSLFLKQRFANRGLDKRKVDFAGFRFILPRGLFPDLETAEIRILGVWGNEATELIYPLEYLWGRRFQLEVADEGEVLKSSVGIDFSITSGAVSGHFDSVRKFSESVRLRGWALDAEHSEIVDSVAIFAGNRFLKSIKPNRQVRVDELGEVLSWCGFEADLPVELFGDLHVAELRIFAVSRRGVASELESP